MQEYEEKLYYTSRRTPLTNVSFLLTNVVAPTASPDYTRFEMCPGVEKITVSPGCVPSG